MSRLTLDILRHIAPRPTTPEKGKIWNAYAAVLASDKADALLSQFGINSNSTRLAMFLANILHETGGLTIIRECMNYTAQGMMANWPHWFRDEAFAKRYEHKPKELANYIYGKETKIGRDLGNTVNDDDGWTYRGGGFMQTTGRSNYREYGKGSGADLEHHPELIEDPVYSLHTACAEWNALKLNAYADKDDFKACCCGVNLGNPNSSKNPIGWPERKTWLTRCKRGLGAAAPRSFEPPSPEDEDAELVLLNRDEYPHGRDTEVPVDNPPAIP